MQDPSSRRRIRLSLLAGAAVTLSACASIPHLGAAPQPKASSAYAAARSFAAPAAEWRSDRWSIASGDSQLDGCGKNRALPAAATSEAGAARADEAQTRLTLSTAVAATYADLAQLYADRDAAEDALRVRADSEGLISARTGQGLETQAA